MHIIFLWLRLVCLETCHFLHRLPTLRIAFLPFWSLWLLPLLFENILRPMDFVMSWSLWTFQLTFELLISKTAAGIFPSLWTYVELTFAVDVFNLKLMERIVIWVFAVFVGHRCLLELFLLQESEQGFKAHWGFGLQVFMILHGFHLGMDFWQRGKELVFIGFLVLVEFHQPLLKNIDEGFDAIVINFLLVSCCKTRVYRHLLFISNSIKSSFQRPYYVIYHPTIIFNNILC